MLFVTARGKTISTDGGQETRGKAEAPSASTGRGNSESQKNNVKRASVRGCLFSDAPAPIGDGVSLGARGVSNNTKDQPTIGSPAELKAEDLFKRLAALFTVSLLGACSTQAIAPSISTFSTATETAVASHLAAFETPEHKSAAHRARLRVLANEGAAYEEVSASDCSYVRPDVRIEPKSFEQACQPKLIAADDKVIATYFDLPSVQSRAERVADALPQDIEILRQHEGIQLAKSLKTYAAALATLSTSTEPEDIGKSLSSAITAIGALHGSFASIENQQGASATSPPSFDRLEGIASVIAREALEAKRYRLLKKLVTKADPIVLRASRQLAILSYEKEKGHLERIAGELQSASMSFDAETGPGIDRTEKALEAMRVADQKAAFRKFDRLQQAHSAIRESFDSPRSAEALIAANVRINDFISAVEKK